MDAPGRILPIYPPIDRWSNMIIARNFEKTPETGQSGVNARCIVAAGLKNPIAGRYGTGL